MAAGFYSGEPTGDPAGVPCDPECWSADCKRSVQYSFAPRPYRDKAYRCWRCGVPDVFTAADQKHAYEVRKVDLSQSRVLCEACHREWVGLEREAVECRRRWVAGRPALLRDLEFLRRWLVVLEALPRFAGANDEANIVMLRRLVAGATRRADGGSPVEPGA